MQLLAYAIGVGICAVLHPDCASVISSLLSVLRFSGGGPVRPTTLRSSLRSTAPHLDSVRSSSCRGTLWTCGKNRSSAIRQRDRIQLAHDLWLGNGCVCDPGVFLAGYGRRHLLSRCAGFRCRTVSRDPVHLGSPADGACRTLVASRRALRMVADRRECCIPPSSAPGLALAPELSHRVRRQTLG